MVGCTEDEFTANANKAENQSGMIELSDNFMIGAVGVDNDATTRTHWELSGNSLGNVFSPIVATPGNNTIGTTAVDAPSIGLCWVGQTVGDDVYTNYEFFHNGWLGKAEEAAVFDICNDGVLKNGWLYSDLTISGTTPSSGEEAVVKTVSGQTVSLNVVAANAQVIKYPGGDATKTALNLNEMNLNSGVYKTENKAIFGGDYIAYYPYNADFKDAGTIPAKSAVVFGDLQKNNEKDLNLAENTFRYTNVASINGGDQAKGFGFNNLSGVIRLVLKSKSTTALTQQIDKVLLYSAKGEFKKVVRLSAAKIKAGAKGTALYASTDSVSKTILATMASGQELTAVASNATGSGLANGTLYLTALPATISDLKVLAHDGTNDKWAECTIGNFEIAAGAGKQLVASYAADDFKKVYYAVDKTTFASAIASCAGLTATTAATIKVLGDIEIETASIPSYVTVEGDKIIVPEDKTLTVSDNAIVKSVVDVKGQPCCGTSTNGGKMTVNAGATVAGNVNVLAGYTGKKAGSLEFTHTANKTSVVAATSIITSAGNIAFNGQTDIRGTLTLNAGTKATVAEANGDVNVKGGTINNNGTIEVLGKFAMLAADGSTVAAAGQNFKNNGTFIDNVGSTVGGATQYMVFGEAGEYICKVDGENRMNEAYENKTAASIIDIVGNKNGAEIFTFAKVRKHNNKDVDIVVSANATKFDPTSAVTIGNLTVNNGLRINKTKEVTGANGAHVGWATITVNGDIEAANNFYLSEDVRNMKAKNLTVVEGGNAKFENRKDSQDKTLVISQAITVQKNGKFEIAAKTAGKNIALVTCTKLVEGGTFIGKPEVVAE